MDQSSSNVPPSQSQSTQSGLVSSPIIQNQSLGGKSGHSTPTPEAELNPQKVKILLQKLKEEMYLAKTADKDDEKRKHLETAEKIKRILVKYQQQQQQQQQQQAKANNSNTNSGDDKTPTHSQQQQQQSGEVQNPSQVQQSSQTSVRNLPQPIVSQSQTPSQPLPPVQVQSQPQLQPSSQSQSKVPSVSSPSPVTTTTEKKASPAPSSIQSPTPQRPTVRPQQQVTLEKYNNVRNTLKALLEKIKTLESSKNTTPEKKEEIDKQLGEIRSQMQKYHTAALHMRNILIDQGRLSANSTPVNGSTGTSSTPTIEKSNLIKAEEIKPNTKPQTVLVPTSKAKQKSQSTSNIPLSSTAKSTTTTTSTTPATHTGTTTPTSTTTKSASTSKSSRPGLAQTPTSATTTTTTPTTATAAATTTTNTTTTTSTTSNKQQLQQPAVDPKVTPSNIPDNDGRVLTKRKLTELINNISVDQGDVKIPIDNDVEDLFLDLADDFVRNIVEFSGRLAKHRKLDRIDIRDVQLNLERNWGLRIPGYATDEIKAARKWQANPEYTEKLNEISKSNKKE